MYEYVNYIVFLKIICNILAPHHVIYKVKMEYK